MHLNDWHFISAAFVIYNEERDVVIIGAFVDTLAAHFDCAFVVIKWMQELVAVASCGNCFGYDVIHVDA